MWTRIYLIFVAIRLYFALSPSYIHPDENFQGPEVIAGEVFSFPNHLTWEFSSTYPVRSIFPLWPIYGMPMEVLRWLWTGTTHSSDVPPRVVYYTLRLLMFLASFVLEDWAIYELVPSPRHKRIAVILVASSYVTWTYQTHTFSNSVETIVVLWCLVLIQRILDKRDRSSLLSSSLLGSFLIIGTFNRITFPAYVLIPMLSLIPHCIQKPLTFLTLLLSSSSTLLVAIASDTAWYHGGYLTFRTLLEEPIFAPLNSLFYNTSTSSLSAHGLHPRYQHFLINLPLLLAPALPLLFYRRPQLTTNSPFVSAVIAMLILSIVPHQEPRFLIPTVPLLLSSISLPSPTLSPWSFRVFVSVWLIFNAALGIVYGRYHQAGVVPAQLWLSENKHSLGVQDHTPIIWWKTYSPPVWLLNAPRERLNTTDLMGTNARNVEAFLREALNSCDGYQIGQDAETSDAVMVVPRARSEPGVWRGEAPDTEGVLHHIRDTNWALSWSDSRHVGLDDLDFAEDGAWGTLSKVVRTRGLQIWRIRRECK